MKYRESQDDIRLRRWFSNSLDQQLLRGLDLTVGALRGVSPFSIKIDFPILAIAGRNGSGKSTLLAIAACAFHSNKREHILKNKGKPYYTFADFFIQHADEISPEGVLINYKIAHNNWSPTPECPDGKGVLYQSRHKKRGGKWNNYDRRVKREVIFLGIERIVPHSEKSQSRSYSRQFVENDSDGWEPLVREAVGYVLNKKYQDFKYVTHSKYRLPLVKFNGVNISGFNMGAGESALFEIFSCLYACGEGALIVVDEIELGLHAEAQLRLIRKIKELSLSRKLQIVFTTHSDMIFGCLPNDARVFIESISGKTFIRTGISPDYAFSKLSSDNSEELDVLVEDKVAERLLSSILPSDIRARIRIEVVGSASSLSRQLAAVYQRGNKRSTLVIFDGDQRKLIADNIKCAKSMLENNLQGFDDWFKSNIEYLPGEGWPEKWIIEKSIEYAESLSVLVQSPVVELTEILIRGKEAEKHKEFYDISTPLGLDESTILDRCCVNLSMNCKDDFAYLIKKIRECLDY
ncbi:AAA family ATPase [Serratia marcescens]|uniref:AAA family ATPase n=1 Tax=Serratia marcescens TaxID=615 RepID=UPI0013DD33FF|nr:AAA family ATPase [Serratia marcescens]NGH08415.1 ATP-binding protein [Serratia marcescens]